jgi:hypothetical protein
MRKIGKESQRGLTLFYQFFLSKGNQGVDTNKAALLDIPLSSINRLPTTTPYRGPYSDGTLL